MKKNTMPLTSLEAYHSLDPDSVENQQKKIVEALKIVKTSTADEMCVTLGFDCWRRFSDLVKDGKIVNTGSKRLTRKGRNAFVFSLPDEPTAIDLKPVEKIMKGKNVSDYSKTIQGIGKGTPLTLF